MVIGMYEKDVEMFVERKDYEEDVAGLQPIMVALLFRKSVSLSNAQLLSALKRMQ